MVLVCVRTGALFAPIASRTGRVGGMGCNRHVRAAVLFDEGTTGQPGQASQKPGPITQVTFVLTGCRSSAIPDHVPYRAFPLDALPVGKAFFLKCGHDFGHQLIADGFNGFVT